MEQQMGFIRYELPTGYKYEGSIDPKEFYNWKFIDKYACPSGHLHVGLENPDITGHYSVVELMIVHDSSSGKSILVAYRILYTDKGVVDVHIFNLTGDRIYVQIK